MVALELKESQGVATAMKGRADSGCPNEQAMDHVGREEEEQGKTTRVG